MEELEDVDNKCNTRLEFTQTGSQRELIFTISIPLLRSTLLGWRHRVDLRCTGILGYHLAAGRSVIRGQPISSNRMAWTNWTRHDMHKESTDLTSLSTIVTIIVRLLNHGIPCGNNSYLVNDHKTTRAASKSTQVLYEWRCSTQNFRVSHPCDPALLYLVNTSVIIWFWNIIYSQCTFCCYNNNPQPRQVSKSLKWNW